MGRLFSRLEIIYLQKWTYHFDSKSRIDDWRAEWSGALDREGISLMDAKMALDICSSKYKNPPSLPQFISLCRYGGMNEDQLYHIAVIEMEKRRAWKEQNWPSTGLFWAASSLGNDLLTMPYQEIAGRWKTALERFCKDRTPIPEEDKGHALELKPTPRKDARKHLDAIRSTLGMKESPYRGEIEEQEKVDHAPGITNELLHAKNMLSGILESCTATIDCGNLS